MTNEFKKRITSALEKHGFEILSNNQKVRTRGIDFHRGSNRIISIAKKGNILLIFKTKAGKGSDPYNPGLKPKMHELSMQTTSMKTLSVIRALTEGKADPELCEKWEGMIVVPVVFVEKSSKITPAYYYYDATSPVNQWFRNKRIPFVSEEWVDQKWDEEFEKTLDHLGYAVSKPVEEKELNTAILEEISEKVVLLSNLISVETHLERTDIPPKVINVGGINHILLLFLENKPMDIVDKVMQWIPTKFGSRQKRIPSQYTVYSFNLSTNVQGIVRYHIPLPEGVIEDKNKFISMQCSAASFIDMIENLGDNFWQPLGQIGDLTDTSEEDLLRHSSMFGLQPVYDQAIKRVDEAQGENCLKCGKNVVKKVETLPPEFPELPSGKLTIYYCDLEEKGCGFTVVISSDEKEGGISVFAPVVFQTDPKEIDAAQHALIDVGLTIHHSKYFDM
ncbi:MAG: hypothetical protein KAR35_01815 [Candidatus Heimdallarchaeota archaeon]|nr:hypothetical protein [Candidatus Heimdallarchaeota archaeon]MCK5048089.1 hypothetical protein [Candidatus Heimdallarchaeota archaeon]